ncbi:MAG: prolipoprotein diacylglyceryl transferase [Phycisphaerae bacterium]|nr:prolipoprotein diacylglyceryl transferase [Phycisphaerae bacterium]MDW8263601.1 prolipoprotein diacylglyceryl transferase [Phycisphaerales bacterium]
MWQEVVRIPLPFSLPLIGHELVVYGFGLMLVIGFLLAMELARFLARRKGLNPDFFSNAAILALFSGILGARLVHVLENLRSYSDPTRSIAQNLADAINISSGGLTYYGGFLLAFPVLVTYALRKGIPVRTGMDIVAPCLMVGLGFGRIGCFLTGCCFGAVCNLPWAVSFPFGSPPYVQHVESGRISPPPQLLRPGRDGSSKLVDAAALRQPGNAALRSLAATQRSLRVHPAQLYSAVTAFLLAGLLLSHFALEPPPGTTFALMLILEGTARFTLELLRVEPVVLWGMSLSMIVAMGMVALGLTLWVAFRRRRE